MQDSKKASMLMLNDISLSNAQSPSTHKERDRMSRIPYVSVIGSIMYVMLCTRLDISYALNVMSQYQSYPGALSWKSFKQETVADSTTNAEYIAASNVAKEATWIKKFVAELVVVPSIADPIDLYCDNNGAIAQAKEPRSYQRSKHILKRFHFISGIIDRRDVKICRIPTYKNLTDPLTKPLVQHKHEAHTKSLDIREMPD
ncbi:hypothetical protein CRG98_014839 [Punica granatum]|uniref:Secreted RxLR effector protein 161-like n=1 Tax=Punica granatum TaxID=22663 RepID=A0A2I0K9B8_PUNGR|nr:hypothetical protein CRG98_014839 [Punica granatum]